MGRRSHRVTKGGCAPASLPIAQLITAKYSEGQPLPQTSARARIWRDADMRTALNIPALLLVFHVVLSAQVTTASFYGTVTDPSGGVVPAAAVTLTSEQTGAVRSTVTDSSVAAARAGLRQQLRNWGELGVTHSTF